MVGILYCSAYMRASHLLLSSPRQEIKKVLLPKVSTHGRPRVFLVGVNQHSDREVGFVLPSPFALPSDLVLLKPGSRGTPDHTDAGCTVTCDPRASPRIRGNTL